MSDRCPWAIRYGARLATRCFLDAGHDVRSGHRGRGVQTSPTVITWFTGDGREFKTSRPDAWSWETDWESAP